MPTSSSIAALNAPWQNPAQFYVGPGGNDSAPGTSESTYMLTVYAAWQKMVARFVSTGSACILNVADQTPVGGPVTGQGLWVTGAFPDGTTIPWAGWLPELPVLVKGKGGYRPVLFGGVGGAAIIGGANNVFRKKPGIWISQTLRKIQFEGIALANALDNPVRVGVDYFRNTDGTVQGVVVASASRPGDGFVHLTLTLPPGIAPTAYDHRATGDCTLTIAAPSAAQTFPPWRVGQWVRITSTEPNVPGGDFQVTQVFAGIDTAYNWNIKYHDGATISAAGSTSLVSVQSHNCGATGEGEYLDWDSNDPTNFPATQYKVAAHTVTTVTLIDPWGGQPNDSGGTCPAIASGTNVGTISHQERVYCRTNGVNFTEKCSFSTGGLLYRSGPCMDFGANLAEIPKVWRVTVNGVAFHSGFPRDDDRMAAVFAAAGGPQAVVSPGLHCEYLGSDDGGIRVLEGGGDGILIANHVLIDTGDFNNVEQPAVEYVGSSGRAVVDIGPDVDMSDMANPPPFVRVTGLPACNVKAIARGPVVAPGASGRMRSQNWGGNNPLPDSQNQVIDYGDSRLSGDHSAGRRRLGPVGARFRNIVSMDTSTWNVGVGVTLTTGITGPDGRSNTAVQWSGSGNLYIRAASTDSVTSFAVGGRVILAGWLNITVPGGIGIQSFGFQGNSGTIWQNSGTTGFNVPYDLGNTGWHWFRGYDVVKTLVGGAHQNYGITAGVASTAIQGDGFTCIYVPPSVPDDDFFLFYKTLCPQPNYLQPGLAGTFEGQTFTGHGGLIVGDSTTQTATLSLNHSPSAAAPAAGANFASLRWNATTGKIEYAKPGGAWTTLV